MTPQAKTVFDAAMALPVEGRADLAKALERRPDFADEHYRPPTPGSRPGFAPGIIAWVAPDFDDELPMEFWLGDDE